MEPDDLIAAPAYDRKAAVWRLFYLRWAILDLRGRAAYIADHEVDVDSAKFPLPPWRRGMGAHSRVIKSPCRRILAAAFYS
jgi:hypothetical protein